MITQKELIDFLYYLQSRGELSHHDIMPGCKVHADPEQPAAGELIEFHGLKMLAGINTHPGSGPLYKLKFGGHKEENYNAEYELFIDFIENYISKDKKHPVMVELGSFWSLWSLVFRKMFPSGKSIIIELGKRQLDVGEKNFKNNGFDFSSYHGGFFLDDSGTFKNKEYDILFPKLSNEYFDDTITGNIVGPDLSFSEIFSKEKLDVIDLLHMDIQSSELSLMKYLDDNNFLVDKILNFMIATHSEEIHDTIKSILLKNEYKIVYEVEGRTWSSNKDSWGSDGMINATKN